MKDSKNEFLREIISHHINNPLMVIQISLDKLKANYPGIEEDKSFKLIERSAVKIKQAVRRKELFIGVSLEDEE